MVSGFLSAIIMVALISVIGWLITLFKKARSLPQELASKASARKLADSEAEAIANSTENAAIRAKYIQLRFEQLEVQGQHSQSANEDSESVELKVTDCEEALEVTDSASEMERPSEDYRELWVVGVFIGFFFFFIFILAQFS